MKVGIKVKDQEIRGHFYKLKIKQKVRYTGSES